MSKSVGGKLHLPVEHKGSAEKPMRASVRFPLRLPVDLHWSGGTLQAVTEDVSSTGVLFLAKNAPEAGCAVRWTLCLPAVVMGTKADITVDCNGRVMWVSRAHELNRLGVVIDQYHMKEGI